MGEPLIGEGFDPIERVAYLAYLSRGYANQLQVAQELGTDSTPGLEASIREIGEEAKSLRQEYGISEEDFFEATFQPEGWRERITYKPR